MNDRERRFVTEYLLDADPTEAALRAGYAPSAARLRGRKLLSRPAVRYAVDRALAARGARTGVTRERVLLEYARIAFADLGRVAEWDAAGVALRPFAAISDDDAAAISGLSFPASGKGEVHIRLHDKGFALEALARHFGLYDAEPQEDAARGARDLLLARIAALAKAG